MKKFLTGMVIVLATTFATTSMAANDYMPKCKVKLQRANGEKVTAYFLAEDCKRLRHVKPGESVQMTFGKEWDVYF